MQAAVRAEEPQLKVWMQAACAGDGGAQRQLLTALAPRLRRFFQAKGSTPDVAEDLVQETLLAVHTRRGLYDSSEPLLPWVYAIARYRLIDLWRRQGRRGMQLPIEDHEAALVADEPEEAVPARDLGRLLAELPDKQRRAIELTKLRELSVAEASRETGWSESDVKVSVHRGLKALMRIAATVPEMMR